MLLLASVSLSCSSHPLALSPKTFAQELTQIESANGKKKVYYAVGDEFFVTGLDLINSYWSEVIQTGKQLLRGHLDNYLPITLKSLEYEPATVMMRSVADYFFGARNQNTGLIPYSYDSWLDKSQTMSTKGKQPVGLIGKGVEICQWFPEDQKMQDNCLALAEETIQYFDVNSENNSGFWGWVDVATGSEPRISLTLTHDYGEVANSLAYLSQQTENPDLMEWADQKLEFVWQNRLNEQLPILNEQFIPHKALLRSGEMSSDTDTLYHVRELFELYQLTGESKYRNWAIAVTNLWYEKAWNKDWGHFIRKLNPDGTAAVNTLYGDGKYNTLYILVHAYEVTQDVKYLERLKIAWNNLLQMGENGFVPEYIKQGKMVEQYGLDKQQTIFLDLLLAAYEVSGDRFFLKEAEDLGKRIISEGEQVMRLEASQAGNAFLRLALARQQIKRLELTLETTNMPLKIKRDNKKILEVIVPAEVAVVYLPEGEYELEVGEEGLSRTKNIKLDQNKKEKMF
ncbi:MAG: hypothetical protein AB4372_19850 [Xenococcus sp. (in: cyanobacteria)]